ncbi:efflux RND transporter periplasmic adaptor subunit [Sphingomonas elodea]|uniref:efflux RND transporter periplasmic adaptor subunit n=1 Tax=Sphingomonas elodea TaxID=179878 RepID=UPI00026302DB|nr:efflux RND transporter periplasmic adaptor subunit [Sphingomonas elodea]
MRLRRIYWLVPVAIAGAGAGGLFWLRQPLAVVGTPVRIGPAADVVYATGFVEAREPVDVAARVTAPITQVLVEEGARVARGQPLARLEDGEQREAIAQLAAQARAAALDEQRTVAIFRRGFATAAARDRVVTTAEAARAAEAAARARLDQYVVRAGIAGVVLRRDAYPGALATPAKILFTLGDPARVRVTATVDERDIPRVLPGQRVAMTSDAYKGRVYRGRVTEITPAGDPNQRAFRVRVAPDGADLPMGLTLELNIETAVHPRALLVPAKAVREGRVWVAQTDRARRVAVQTGIEGGDMVEVRAGIAPGTCVLVDPPATLADGARVKVAGC